jgi:hypothetical protein
MWRGASDHQSGGVQNGNLVLEHDGGHLWDVGGGVMDEEPRPLAWSHADRHLYDQVLGPTLAAIARGEIADGSALEPFESEDERDHGQTLAHTQIQKNHAMRRSDRDPPPAAAAGAGLRSSPARRQRDLEADLAAAHGEGAGEEQSDDVDDEADFGRARAFDSPSAVRGWSRAEELELLRSVRDWRAVVAAPGGDERARAAFRNTLSWLALEDQPWLMVESWRDVAGGTVQWMDAHRSALRADADSATAAAFEHERALLEQELHTWELVRRLYLDADALSSGYLAGSRPAGVARAARSEAAVVADLLARDVPARFLHTVVSWLESVRHRLLVECERFPSGAPVAVRPPLPSREGVDARYQRAGAAVDAAGERVLFEQCWALMRCGRLDEVVRLLRSSGQSMHAAAMVGHPRPHHAELSPGDSRGDAVRPCDGNPKRLLWQGALRQLAEVAAGRHEAAMFAVLAGDLPRVLAVCDDWEDEVWARLRVLRETVFDAAIAARRNGWYSEAPAAAPGASAEDLGRVYEKMRDAMEAVLHSDRAGVRRELDQPYRIIQTYIILDDLGGLLSKLREWLAFGDQLPASVLQFAAFFVILVRPSFAQREDLRTEDANQAMDEIVEAFALSLMRSGRPELLAQFASLLPPKVTVQLYSTFLRGLSFAESDDAAELPGRPLTEQPFYRLWRRFYDYGVDAGLPMAEITCQVVRQSHDLVPATPAPQSVVSMRMAPGQLLDIVGLSELHTTTEEKHLDMIRAVHWLSFDEAQRGDLLAHANALCRFFLLECAFVPAVRLMESIQESPDLLNVSDEDDVEFSLQRRDEREFQQLMYYLKFQRDFVAWRQRVAAKPLRGRLSAAEYATTKAQWKAELQILTLAAVDKIQKLLQWPGGGWLRESSSDGQHAGGVDAVAATPYAARSGADIRQGELRTLRRLHVPRLVLLLHDMLFWLKSYGECAALSTWVVEQGLLDEFSAEQARLFLERLRRSTLAQLAK